MGWKFRKKIWPVVLVDRVILNKITIRSPSQATIDSHNYMLKPSRVAPANPSWSRVPHLHGEDFLSSVELCKQFLIFIAIVYVYGATSKYIIMAKKITTSILSVWQLFELIDYASIALFVFTTSLNREIGEEPYYYVDLFWGCEGMTIEISIWT